MQLKTTFLTLFALSAWQHLVFSQNWNLTNATVNQCAGTFFDSGGAGNYGNNQNITGTICPSTPGMCVALNFTSFNTEEGFDILRVYDSNSSSNCSNATAAWHGTDNPGYIVANNPSGCLTFNFTSDGSVTNSGWQATISCVACGTPSTTTFPPVDCFNSVTVCDDQQLNYNSNGEGFDDFTGSNISANGCLSGDEHQSAWFQVNIAPNSPPNAILSFTLSPTAGGGEDYDFALYGPNTSCCNLGNPVRCSFAASACGYCPQTGMGNGATDFTENAAGDGFVAPLTVQPGQTYFLLIDNYLSSSQGFFLDWTGNAVLGCACSTVPVISGTTTLCPGQTTSLTAIGTNLTTYAWTATGGGIISGATNGASIIASTAGTYTVSVTNATGCTGFASAIVTQAQVPNINNTVNGATCGQSNGSINLTVSAGTPPYTFNWSNSANTEDLLLIPSGSYTVTVTGTNGCTATTSINVPNTNITLNVSGTTTNNTSCSAPNGAVNISVTPAGTYTFNWSNSATTEDLSNVASGSYTVTVTGGGSCTGTATFIVANNATPVTFDTEVEPATCGQSNGAAEVDDESGAGPFTYLWSNTGTTQEIEDLPAGTYTVTVTASNGCTATASVVVPNNSPPINVAGTATANTLCTPGSGNGGITITVTPSGTYTYVWSNGATSQNLLVIPSGTYSVTVSSGGSCSQTASFTVPDQPNLPVPTLATVASTCGMANGDVNLTVSGGVTPYVFNWSNSATTQNLDNVLAGSYSVTVTGANGCSAVASATLTNANPPINVTGTATANTLCTPGSGNGGITITVTPAGTYTYVWSNSATSQNLTNLAPGSYTVTVSAGGTCSQTANFTVPDQPNLPVPTLATVASTCGMANGDVNLTVSGGVTPYVFNWSNSATTQNLDNVLAGSYSVTVTGANGCSAVASATLTNTNLPINVTGTTTANTLCTPGSGNGGIAITVTPAGTYTYVWSNGATSQNLLVIPSGTYSVTVSAGGSCSQTASFTVPDQPNLPVPTLATVASTCGMANGDVNLTVSGGVTPYVFNWSNSATTQNLDNVLAGSYSVTVTGANGCSAVASATLTNTNLPINVTGTATANTLCTPGSGNGGITITVTPAGTYTYVWSNGATSQNLLVIPSGAYSVTVSAGGSCSQTASFTVPDQPNLPVPTLATVASTCGMANGDVNLTVSGGVTPYVFNWSNSATTQNLDNVLAGSYSVTVTGANGCSAVASATLTNTNLPINVTGTATANTLCTPGSGNGGIAITVTPAGTYTYLWSNGATSQNLTNLAPGSYSVTVSAGGSCSQTANFTVPDQPNLPVPTLATVASTCGMANGDVNLTVSGGVTPYVFNWSNSATTQNLDNVLAGSYSVTVTGANGCSAVASATLTNTNLPITVSGTTTANTLCTSGSGNGGITITVTPAGTYTYVWSNGATSQNLLVIPSGTYSVTVSAGGSCSQTANFTVPDQPNLPTVSATTVASTCNLPNGSASVSVSGGVSPFTFNWSNSGSTSSIANVASGSYSVTVTGANGCSAVSSLTIPNNNVLLDISGVVTPNTTCAGGNGGIALTVNPAGTYTVNWSNNASGMTLNNLAPGSYSVTVSAGGTCTNSANFTVPDNSEVPSLSTAVTGTSCNLTNGAVDLSVSGGTLPYTYNWSNAQTVQDLNGILAGGYSVTVTSAAGCTAVASANVPNTNPNFTVNGIATGSSSCTAPNGSVNVSVTPPGTYTYIWSNNATTNAILNLAAGTYTVTVSAGGSCTQVASFPVLDIVSLPNLATTTNPGTCGNPTGSVNLVVSNGTAPFSFAWSNSAVSQNLGNVGFGTYTVTVTDANGCTATTSASVGNVNFNISLNATPTPVTSCTVNNGAVNLVVSPAVPNAGLSYAFTWSNAATAQNLSNLAAGSYTVTVTAGADCSAVTTVIVPNNATPPNLATSSDPALCGLNNGEASVTATGGATPYTYLWSNNSTGNGISGVGAGTYTVTVSGSNGCSATASVNVPNNNIAINVTAAVTALTSCSVSNGGLNISMTPASPPIGNYTFIWSNSATTEDLANLAAGNYSVTVSAGGSCTAAATFSVPNSTSAPVVTPIVTAAICGLSNGAINLSVSGATTPYTFLWSNSQSTQNLASLTSGNYTVTVTAGNGCTSSVTVNVPNNSSTFALTGIATPLTNCTGNNGAVNLSITPAGTYSFAWSNSATTEDISNLAPGTYTVTVTQSGSCTATASFVVDNLTTLPSLSQVITAAVCGMPNGGIDLSVSGGATPYNYIWTNSATTQDLTAVAAGNYAVTVTSAGTGCSATGAFTVPANNVSFSLSGVTTVNTACNVSNGGVNLTVTPAGTYTFLWSNNAVTEDLSGVPGGTYSVTVSAGGTCVNTANFTVGDATDSPSVTENVTPALCGQSNGGIDITASGSTTPYAYAWSNGYFTQDISGITAGNYFVTVTGANGCASVSGFLVPDNQISPPLTGTPTPNTSCNQNNGGVTLVASPVIPYTYLWSNNATTQNLVNVPSGSYSVTVSAGGSCFSVASFNVPSTTADPVVLPTAIPAICGESNGGVTLVVSGATTPYTFEWSNNATTQNLTNIPAGNYDVTVTGGNGCNAVSAVTVPDVPVIFSITGTPAANTLCTGGANGAVNLSVSPAGSYDFLWSNNATTEDLIALAPATYTVTVTLGSNCTNTASFTVANNTNAPVFSQTVTPAACGNSAGGINLTVSGGTAPYAFNWSNSATTEDLANLPAGTYAVTVSGADGCANTGNFAVPNEVIPINVTGTASPNTSCAGGTGGVTTSVSPATGLNYTYLWSNNATTPNLSAVIGGNYSVTVSAGGGCSAVAAFTVPSTTNDPVISQATTPAVCGGSNGGINLTLSGSTTPYAFAWSNAATTEDLANVAAGSYSVTVTGGNGCQSVATVNLADNPVIFSVTGTPSANTLCTGENGAINVSISPSGIYDFEWNTNDLTEDLSDLAAGTYTVTVTLGINCTNTASFTVGNNTNAPVFSQVITPSICGNDGGGINLTATGGATPYTFEWSNSATTEDLVSLPSGNYAVTVSGADGCANTGNFAVPDDLISINISGSATANTACVDGNGSVSISVVPAVPPSGSGYIFDWTGGETTQNLSNVPDGNYAVTVSAGGGCTSVAQFTVPNTPDLPTILPAVTASICGAPDGAIELTVSGGGLPYDFNWSNGTGNEDLSGILSGNYSVTVTAANGCTATGSYNVANNSNTFSMSGLPTTNTLCVGGNGGVNLTVVPAGTYGFNWTSGATTEDLSNLPPGTYTVTVNDGGSCTASATFTVADASPEVALAGTPTHNLCFGDAAGAIDLSASGGVPPYNYVWMPAQNGNPQDPQNLGAGNYSVLVTDASGCTGTASFSIQQPLSGLSLDCSQSSSVSVPGANDGVGGVNISGGTAPYSVAWLPGGVQNNVGTGVFSINNLTEGSYLVAVEDANGCPAACDFLINAVECETQLGSMSNSLVALCGNGCITADYNAIGQFLDADDVLEFVLHEGSGNQIVNEIARNEEPVFCFDPALMSYGTTYYVSAVAGNDDGNGNVDLSNQCTVVALGTPVIFEEQPVASAAPPAELNCAVSEVGLSGSSDLPGSTFEWSATGGGVLSGNANSPDVMAGAAGSYTLIVQAGNCADTVEVAVLDFSNEVQALISASPNDLLDCTIHEIMLNGTVAGSANANIYWLYNDQVFSNQSAVPITVPGMYEFIALDTVTLCSDTALIEIDEDQSYPPLFVNAPDLLTCANEVTVLSGGSPFPGIVFSWATISGNDTTIVGNGSSIEVGVPGEYFLLGVDPSNNCTNALPANVDADFAEPTADAGLPFTMDCFGEIAALDGSGSSGIGILTFSWTTADGNLLGSGNVASPNIDEPGTYLLTVTQSGNGCSASDEVLIGSEAPVVSPSVIQPPCFGDEGTIVVEAVIGGSPPFQYALEGGSFSGQNSFQNVAPGIYQVTVLDAEGCIGTAEAIVEQPDLFQIAVEANAVIELGDSYQIVTQVSIPESEIGQVSWTPVNGTLSCDTCLNPLATPLTTTAYHVEVVSKNGCRDDAALLLRVDKSGGVYVPNSFSPNGDGTNDLFMIYADPKSVVKVRQFLVFSRWGETVYQYYNFEPNHPAYGWDGSHRGEPMNPAVFVWFAEIEMVDGRIVLFEGDVTLLR